jgi:hypothetical protein
MPGTARQIAAQSGVELACVRDHVGVMLRAEQCHVAGFELNDPGMAQGAPTFMPVLALGVSPDPEMPKDSRGAVTYYTDKLTLAAMPNTVPGIAGTTGLPETSICRKLISLHADEKCHVGGWKRSARGLAMAVYHAGPGEDVPCRLKNFTGAQKSQRYMRKLRTDKDLVDKLDARRSSDRSRYWEKKALVRRDPLTAALFGSGVAGAREVA